MGISPVDAGRMSLWQYMSAVDGFAQENADDKALSSSEEEELWADIQRMTAEGPRPRTVKK